MTTVKGYSTPTAAGAEIHSRAERYVSEHQGVTYQEAVNVVLKADKQLAESYAAPTPRRRVSAMATTDARSEPAVPVTADVEREILDWMVRALDANMAGSLPGALGQLTIEADKLARIGMPVEEAARRAMGAHPHLVAMARLLLTDVRRNELVPTGEDKPAQGNPAGFEVHVRAEALMQKHPHLDYREAVGAVLSEDTQLKVNYAGVK